MLLGLPAAELNITTRFPHQLPRKKVKERGRKWELLLESRQRPPWRCTEVKGGVGEGRGGGGGVGWGDPSLSADPEPQVAGVRAGRATWASRERTPSVISGQPSDQRCLLSDVFLEGRHWDLGRGWRRNVTFISLLRWLHFHSEPLPGSFTASLTWAAHPAAGQARLLIPTTKPAPLPLCPISGKCQNLPFCSSPAPPTSIHPSAHRTLQILLESIHISYPHSLVQGPAAQMTHHWSALFYPYSSSTFHVETRRHFFSLNFLGSL